MRSLLFLFVMQQAHPQRSVELTGFVLVNGFYTSARVNNSDVPQFAENDPTGIGAIGGAIRQTRLGVSITEADLLGGDFSREGGGDFFGGYQPGRGGRNFSFFRL